MKTLSELGVPFNKAVKWSKEHICAECGGALFVEAGSYYGKSEYIIRCHKNKDHTEFGKLYKEPTEEEERINTIRSLTKLGNDIGHEKTRALENIHKGAVVTEDYARKIADILWKGAPETDKVAAILYCAQYNLDPLNNELNLIPFKNKNGGVDYARVRGIKGDRRIAKNAGDYSYIDDSPRIMTPEEEHRINGEVDPKNIWAICKTKNMITGAISVGYGCWPRNVDPYGMDKGNTKANMARVRAERQCLDRMCPGKLPPIDARTLVMDDDYIPKVNNETGEIIDGEAREVESPKAQALATPAPQPAGAVNDVPLICPDHNIELRPNKWGGYSHILPGETNTRGKQAYCTWAKESIPELMAAIAKKAASEAEKQAIDPVAGKDMEKTTEATPAPQDAKTQGQHKMITDAQQMLEMAEARWGLTGPDVLQILGVSKWSEVKDLQLAWEKIIKNQEPN